MSNDLIRRSDAMRVALWLNKSELKYSPRVVKKRVMEIPTAEPKRGEWIYQFRDSENEEYRCSKCGFPQGDKPNFCPNCGADMRGE